MKKPGPHNRFELENLEPRILLSADTALAASSIDLPEETESGTDIDLLPLDEVALGDDELLKENSFQNQPTYNPSQSLDDIFAGLAEDNLMESSENEQGHEDRYDSESEYEDDLAGEFEHEIKDENERDNAHGFEDEHEDGHEFATGNHVAAYQDAVITSHQQDQIVRGLNALSRFGDVLESFDAFAAKLNHTIDRTVGAFFGFVEFFDTRLAKPVFDYFNDATDPPDTRGMLKTIENTQRKYGNLEIAVDSLDGGITPSKDAMQYDLKITATRRGDLYSEYSAEGISDNSKEKQMVAESTVESELTDGENSPSQDGLQPDLKIEATRLRELYAIDSTKVVSQKTKQKQSVAIVRADLKLDTSLGVDLTDSNEFFVIVRQFDTSLSIESRVEDTTVTTEAARAPPEDSNNISEPDLLISLQFSEIVTADGRITLDELEAIDSETIEDLIVLFVSSPILPEVSSTDSQSEAIAQDISAASYPNEPDARATSLSNNSTDIRHLKTPILNALKALSELADGIDVFEDLNVDLPIIGSTINQLIFADPDAGFGTVFDFYTPALEYFNLLEVFNLDLSDELTLSRLGALPEIAAPKPDLENETHRRRLSELIESKYELALDPDWDINLYLPEIWGLLHEDFQIDEYLPRFQLLLGLPYLPRWDQTRSDMKSYFDSSANLRGLQDYIRTVSLDPLYEDYNGRTTTDPFSFSGGYLQDSDVLRFDFFMEGSRKIDFTVALQSLLADKFSDSGLTSESQIAFTPTLGLALDFSVRINPSRDGPQTDDDLFISVNQAAVTVQVHEDLKSPNGVTQNPAEANSGTSIGRFDFDARLELLFHGLDPPGSPTLTFSDLKNLPRPESLIDIQATGTLAINFRLASNLSTSPSDYIQITSDDTFDPAATVAAVQTGAAGVRSWIVNDNLTIGSHETLYGNGVINGSLTLGGVLSPGNSPGITAINGDLTIVDGNAAVIDDDYTPGAGSDTVGVLDIEIGGTGGAGAANGHDQVIVNGTLNLGGLLRVSLINKYIPEVGQEFEIITYESADAGDFATFEGMQIGVGGFFNPVKGPTGYTLQVVGQVNHLLPGNPETTANLPNKSDADNYRIQRPQYTLSYNDSVKGPNWVAWQLNAQWLAGNVRNYRDSFRADDALPSPGNHNTGDSYFSGVSYPGYAATFARGHMVPNADMKAADADNLATYYMTNILPQWHNGNNNGAWSSLEGFSRKLVTEENRELYILAGGYGTLLDPNSNPVTFARPGTDGTDVTVTAPERIWKVIFILDQPGQALSEVGGLDGDGLQKRVIAVDFPNAAIASSSSPKWTDPQYLISVDELEDRTGYDFLSNPALDGIEAVIENQAYGGDGSLLDPDAINPGGNGPGVDNVATLNLTDDSSLVIEIGGVNPGPGPTGDTDNGYDQIRVAGDINLDGELNIVLINDFVPTEGDTFDFIVQDAPSTISGAFDDATGLYGFGDGSLYFDIIELSDRLRLEVKQVPGGKDLQLITPTEADADSLGKVFGGYFSGFTANVSIEIETADFVTISGDFAVGRDVATGDIAFLSDNATVWLNAGTTIVSIENATLALLLDGAEDAYALYGAGDALLTVSGVGSVSGTFTVRQNKSAMTTITAQTVTIGSVSVDVPELAPLIESIEGENVEVQLEDFLKITGDFAVAEDLASGDIAVLISDASAVLDAGTTTVGVENASLALLLDGAEDAYALYGTGDALLNVSGVGSVSGTFTVRQNKSATTTIPAQTVTIGSVSVDVPVLAPQIESIEGEDVEIQLQDFLTITGDFAVAEDLATGDIAVLIDDASAVLDAGTTTVGIENASLALLLDGAEDAYALYGTGDALLNVTGVGSVTGTFTVRQNKSAATTIPSQTVTIGSVSVDVPELAPQIESIEGENVEIQLQDFLTINGDFAVAEDLATGDIAVLIDDASAILDAGTTTVGVENASLVLLLDGAEDAYALFGTGDALLNVTGVGSVTGTFTVRQNKSATTTIPAQTVTIGSVSVDVPELAPQIESIEGENVEIQLLNFLTITGDFAVAEDLATGDIAVLIDDASAVLDAGTTTVGVENASLALLLDGAEDAYALFGNGDALLNVTGVGSVTGTFTVRQNKSATTTIPAQTVTIGSVSVDVPELAPQIESIEGEDVEIQLLNFLTITGDFAVAEDLATGDIAVLISDASAILVAGTTTVGVENASLALLLDGAEDAYALYGTGDALLNVTGVGSVSGTLTVRQNKSATTTITAQAITIGSVSVDVPELAPQIESIEGEDVEIQLLNFLTITGDIAVAEDLATGDIAILIADASAVLDAGTTTVGVENASLALLLDGAEDAYALYGTGDALLNVTGVGSVSGTFTVRQNKSATTTIPAQTVTIGSVSVDVPELAPQIESIEGEDVEIQLLDFLTITGDFAVAEDLATGDIAVLISDASAVLDAGTTTVGVENASLALLLDGAEDAYALFGNGDALLNVTGVGSVTGTFTVRQNKSAASTIPAQTVTIGSVSVDVPELAPQIESIEGEDVEIQLLNFLKITGDFAVAEDLASGNILVLIAEASATLEAGPFTAAVGDANIGLLLPASGGYALYADGNFALTGGDFASVSGTAFIRDNTSTVPLPGGNLTVGSTTVTVNAVPAGVREISGHLTGDIAGFVSLEADFGLERQTNGDILIIAGSGSAALTAGPFSAGVNSAQIGVKLFQSGGHAVYADGNFVVSGGGLANVDGTVIVKQNTSTTETLTGGSVSIGATTATIGTVSADTPGEITGTATLEITTGGSDPARVAISGDFGVKKDAGGDIVAVIAGGSVTATVGSFSAGAENTAVALILKADGGHALYASGDLLLSGSEIVTAIGTVTVQENTASGPISAQTITVGIASVTIPTLPAGVFTAEGDLTELEITGLATISGTIAVTKTGSDIRVAAQNVTAKLAENGTFSAQLTGQASLVMTAAGTAIYAAGAFELSGLAGNVEAAATVTLERNSTGATVDARTVTAGSISVVTPELAAGTKIEASGSLTAAGQNIGGTFIITPNTLSNGKEVIDIRARNLSIEADFAGIVQTSASGTGDFQIRDTGIAGVATIRLPAGTEIGVEFNTTNQEVLVGSRATGDMSTLVAGDYFRFNLKSFNIDDIRELFQQVRLWLNDLIAGSELFNIDIPFVDKSVRELIDLGGAWLDGVLAKLDFGTMGSLDDFITAFNASGLLPGGGQVSYEDAGRTLTIPLSFNHTLGGLQDVPLNFDLDLGDLAGISTAATAQLTASVSGQVTLIVDVDGPTGTEGVTLIVENASLTGTAGFAVGTTGDPLQITGRLGFVEITAGGQAGSTIQANATATLTIDGDGNLSTTDDRRFTLDELKSQLADAVHLNFAGSAEATLVGISIGGNFGSIAGADSAELGIKVPRFKDLAGAEVIKQGELTETQVQQKLAAGHIIVTLPDLSDLLSLKNLDFATILDMLRGGIDWLKESLADQGFYKAQIPVVGGSLESILTFVQEWTEKLDAVAGDAGATLQAVEQVLEAAFGINDDNRLPFKDQKFALKLDGSQLVVHLRIDQKLPTINKNFALKLSDLVDGIEDVDRDAMAGLDELVNNLDVQARGTVSVDAAAAAVLDIGVDLDNIGRFFVRKYNTATEEGSQLRLEAAVRGTGLELGFMIPPGITVGVRGGSVALDLDGNPSTQSDNAYLAIGLNDHYQIGDRPSLPGLLQVELKGRFNVNLPVAIIHQATVIQLSKPISLETDPSLREKGLEALFKFLIKQGDNPLKIGFPSIKAEFEALFGQLSLLGLLNNPSFVLDGIDSILSTLEEILASELALDVPLIGDKFGQAANFLGDFREGLLADLRVALQGTSPVQLLVDSLNRVLGPQGLNILESPVQARLITKDGSQISGWQPGDLIPAEADAIEFDMHLGQKLTLADLRLNLGFDMPALGLDLNTGLEIVAEWDLDFGFGVSESDLFYFKTRPGNELEVQLSANLKSLSGDGSLASGKLMFFHATASDVRSDGPSGVSATFAIDVLGQNGRLTVNRMFSGLSLSDLFDVSFAVDANVQLGLGLTMGGNMGLPSLAAGLSLTWHWEYGQRVRLPNVSLTNITIDLGTLLTNFLQPIAREIQNSLTPFKPIVDALTETIEGFTDERVPDVLRQEPNLMGLINLINYLMGKQPIDWSFVKAAKSMMDFAEAVAKMSTSGSVELGSIHNLLGDRPSLSPKSVSANPFSSLSSKALGSGSFGSFNPRGAARTHNSSTAFWAKLAEGVDGLVPASSRPQQPARPDPGLEFWSHITSLENWMKLLKGRPAELFTYVMPVLKVEFDFTVTLFKIGPANLNATGGFAFQADLIFGYDTFGIQQALKNGNPWDAIDGFYIRDNFQDPEYYDTLSQTDQLLQGQFERVGNVANGKRMFDRHDFMFNAYIGLQAEASVGFASGGVEGRIKLNVGFNLNDVDNDDKIRLSEIATLLVYPPTSPSSPTGGAQPSGDLLLDLSDLNNLQIPDPFSSNTITVHPLNLFDITVVVTAEVLLFFDSWFTDKSEFELAKFNLFDAQWIAPDPAPELSNGSRLNMGRHAEARRWLDKQDGGEHFKLVEIGGSVWVFYKQFTNEDGETAFRWKKNLGGVTLVTAFGEQGNDIIDTSEAPGVFLQFEGGVGNDTVILGAGGGNIDGGDGNDTIDASRATTGSVLRGGATATTKSPAAAAMTRFTGATATTRSSPGPETTSFTAKAAPTPWMAAAATTPWLAAAATIACPEVREPTITLSAADGAKIA